MGLFYLVYWIHNAYTTKMNAQQLASRIQSHALRLLAAREYTRAEIHSRLMRWLQRRQAAYTQHQSQNSARDTADNYLQTEAVHTTIQDDNNAISYATAIEQVLDKLEKTGLLNDQRAAEALVRSQSARFGVARVRYALKNKGVTPELSEQVLDDLHDSEAARAYQVWQKKYGTLPQNSKEYARQMRFLAYRGFATETIHEILRGSIEH